MNRPAPLPDKRPRPSSTLNLPPIQKPSGVVLNALAQDMGEASFRAFREAIKPCRRGFTVIELLITIGVIAALAVGVTVIVLICMALAKYIRS